MLKYLACLLYTSITGLPADILGLKDRGTLEEGRIADITVFDLSLIHILQQARHRGPAGGPGRLSGGPSADGFDNPPVFLYHRRASKLDSRAGGAKGPPVRKVRAPQGKDNG